MPVTTQDLINITSTDEPGKKPIGRPTSWNPEVKQKAIEYLSDNEDINYKSHGHAIPSIVGLCRVLNRSRSTLYNWTQEKGHEFLDILIQSNEFTELETLNGALTGKLNANISKLVLGKFGYTDKAEVKAEVEEKSIGNNELARRLAFVLAQGVTVEGEAEQIDE